MLSGPQSLRYLLFGPLYKNHLATLLWTIFILLSLSLLSLFVSAHLGGKPIELIDSMDLSKEILRRTSFKILVT